MNSIARLYARLCAHVLPDFDLSDIHFTADDARPTDDYRPTCGTAIRAVTTARTTLNAERPRTVEGEPREHPTLVPARPLSAAA